MIYAVNYERMNFNFTPPLEEKVVVLLETDLPFDDEHIEEFDSAILDALRKQYPIWICPYNSENQPPNHFEKARHGFSTPFIGQIRRIMG